MSKILKQIRCYYLLVLLYGNIAAAETYIAQEAARLHIIISKSGLNRISNPPYKITSVTGDNSKFSFKYDEDGSNIYFMPLSPIGELIEISIKNNAGFVQDLEFEVAGIKGKSIIIDGRVVAETEKVEKSDIAQMLRAMRDNKTCKFYVQNIKQKFELEGFRELGIEQQKIYKYKNLTGAVFMVINPTKNPITFDVASFAKHFDNVKSSYPSFTVIDQKKAIRVLIVQKLVRSEEK